MQRFIITENIARFRQRLRTETEETVFRTVQTLLANAQRELALFDSGEAGAGTSSGCSAATSAALVAQFLREVENSAEPYLLLDPGPGLRIIGQNAAHERATLSNSATLVGKRLFDVFPDNPDLPFADGIRKLFESLCIAAGSGKPHTTDVLRYDQRDAGGRYIERHWRITNTPVFTTERTLAYMVNHPRDVTADVLSDGAAAIPV